MVPVWVFFFLSLFENAFNATGVSLFLLSDFLESYYTLVRKGKTILFDGITIEYKN